MSDNTATVKTIETLERLNNSANGNPRYRVTFTDGTQALTETDGQVGYMIENRPNHGVPLHVTFTRNGRIKAVKPVQD